MRKVALLFATVCLWGMAQAQESVVKISGLDAAFGRYEVSYERTFNEGMNNIKSSGRMRGQKKWPNILTKGSLQLSFSYINKKHDQTFGSGLTAVIDTNSNHHPNFNTSKNTDGTWVDPDNRDTRITDDPSIHSVERKAVATVSGIAFEAEYRSYIKTYTQSIGDAPRGWYIAPFARFQTTTLDFDDNTLEEVNQAMNYLMDPTDADNAFAVFGNYAGPWEGQENDANPAGYQDGFVRNMTINPMYINNGMNNAVFNAYGGSTLEWHDVSFKQNETVIAAGLAIGRQWLISDKFSIDVQVGPQYKIVTRSERKFNGNDTWNATRQGNSFADKDGDMHFFTKYGDVFSYDGTAIDPDFVHSLYGMVDEDGEMVIINSKTDDSTLNYTQGFYRDLPGLTDFGRLETYRLKVRLGYAF